MTHRSMIRATLCVLALAALTTVAHAATVDLKDLALWLTFDEGKGKTAKDGSPNGLTAKLNGDADWDAGKYGGALKVSGIGYALVKDDPALDLGDEMTMEAWVNIDSLPNTYSSILTKPDVYMMHLDQEARPANTVGVEPFLWPKVEWPPILKKNVVPLKEWHYVVGVFTGKERLVYIDGKLADSAPHTDAAKHAPADVSIGYDSRGCCNTRQMNALIDDVRLWNRALSADEIATIYRSGFSLAVEPQGKAATLWGALKSR